MSKKIPWALIILRLLLVLSPTNHLVPILVVMVEGASSSVPTGILELYHSPSRNEEPFQVTVGSLAAFGKSLPFGKPKSASPVLLEFTPDDDVLLCQQAEGSSSQSAFPSHVDLDFIYVIPRGGCSFEQKVLQAQRLGAKGAIITDNLSSKYDLQKGHSNFTLSSIIWPQDIFDYNCDTEFNAKIPKGLLYFDQLPYDSRNDILLSDDNNKDGTSSTNTTNLCRVWSLGEAHKEQTCASKRCLLTGKGEYSIYHDDVLLQACCANDFFFQMGSDSSIDDSVEATIPSVFLNMKEGYHLLHVMQQNGTIYVMMYERPYPRVNWSSFFVYTLAVFVVWLAGWISAKEFRDVNRLLQNCRVELYDSNPSPPVQDVEMVVTNINNLNNSHRNENDENNHPISVTNDPFHPMESSELIQSTEEPSSIPNSETGRIQNMDDHLDHANHPTGQTRTSNLMYHHHHRMIHMELKMSQAIMFLFLASLMLFFLYFSHLYEVVTVVYTIGATFATIQMLIHPSITSLFRFLGCSCWIEKPAPSCISFLHVLSSTLGVFLGVYWLWIGFTINSSNGTNFFQWFYQDIMGVCVCVSFLRLIRLNSIMVATVLLAASFMYDIFFVFLTPYIFGESIMESVASGSSDSDDSVICDIDPDATGCKNLPLPMLITFPRLNDYRGGFSMLGLGDIVLPGLLIVFAARLDASKKLVSTYSTRLRAAQRGETDVNRLFQHHEPKLRRIFSGYFFPIVMAYATGLFFANLAVYVMKHGQPALLYLVPCTLITFLFMGWKNQELSSLWIGHKKIGIAEEIRKTLVSMGPNRVGIISVGARGDDSFAETGSASLSDEFSLQTHNLN